MHQHQGFPAMGSAANNAEFKREPRPFLVHWVFRFVFADCLAGGSAGSFFSSALCLSLRSTKRCLFPMDLYPSLYIHIQSLTQSPSNRTSPRSSRKGVKFATSYKMWGGSEACGCQRWSSGKRQMEMQNRSWRDRDNVC